MLVYNNQHKTKPISLFNTSKQIRRTNKLSSRHNQKKRTNKKKKKLTPANKKFLKSLGFKLIKQQ